MSLEYRTQLVVAKEEAGETKAASYLCSLNHIESQRRIFRNIRFMEGKKRDCSTSKLISIQNGIEIEHTKREDIEKICADTNDRKYYQTVGQGSQLLLHEYINDLGSYGEGPKITNFIDEYYTFPPSVTQETKDFLHERLHNMQRKLHLPIILFFDSISSLQLGK